MNDCRNSSAFGHGAFKYMPARLFGCNRRNIFASALLLFPAVPVALAAQGVVGAVHATSGEPLVNAVISTSNGMQTARTDRSGLFRIQLPVGTHLLTIRRIGYEPARLSAQVNSTSATDTIEVTLTPASLELKGIIVNADRDEKMALTLSSETLRNAPPLGESDVIRSLPLLPAISQPNDVIDVIHLAGGASDEAATRLAVIPCRHRFMRATYSVH